MYEELFQVAKIQEANGVIPTNLLFAMVIIIYAAAEQGR